MTLRVLDLFSGIGAYALGVERAGMKVVAFCECEKFPRRVLRKHWPEVHRDDSAGDSRMTDMRERPYHRGDVMSDPVRGRRRPYTARGIARLRCIRCKNRAHASWQICADGRLYRPLCVECDIALNQMVMRWAFGRRREADLRRYAASILTHAANTPTKTRPSLG